VAREDVTYVTERKPQHTPAAIFVTIRQDRDYTSVL